MTEPTMTAEEISESLTGFDEIAITKAFHTPLHQLEGTLPARALVFVLKRRAGLTDGEAYKASMELSQSSLMEQFGEDSEVAQGN